MAINTSTPNDYEDSVTRIATREETATRAIKSKFDKRTITLIDGPHAGEQVEYWEETQLVESAPNFDVQDDYQGGETLPDQTGAGGVLTFTFSSPVNMVVIDANGQATDVARADPFGGTPSSSQGVVCRDETPVYMPVITSSVQVFAPNNMIVSVWGFRRA